MVRVLAITVALALVAYVVGFASVAFALVGY
jgi:hypothetical protein